MDSVVRWMVLCLLTTLVATCGQKGPLYLPEKPATGVQERAYSPGQVMGSQPPIGR